MPGMRLLVLSVIAIVILVLVPACSMEHLLRRDSMVHSGKSACVTCHRTTTPSSSDSGSSFAGGIDPSAACLDCHHYNVNHHPVNVAPDGEYARKATGALPLYDGQVRCLTCHQAHTDAGCGNLKGTPALLRGGPYADKRTLCFMCHYAEKYAEINPHKMLDENGNIRTVNGSVVCLLCHTEKPDPSGDPGNVEFKADVAFLCQRCHTPMKGTFLDSHLHITPSRSVRSLMKKNEKASDIAMPLALDGMITCSTCHNPHQSGVILRKAASAGADAPGRLRIAKEEMCTACHLM